MTMKKGTVFHAIAFSGSGYPHKQLFSNPPHITPAKYTEANKKNMRCIFRVPLDDPREMMFIGWTWLSIGQRIVGDPPMMNIVELHGLSQLASKNTAR